MFRAPSLNKISIYALYSRWNSTILISRFTLTGMYFFPKALPVREQVHGVARAVHEDPEQASEGCSPTGRDGEQSESPPAGTMRRKIDALDCQTKVAQTIRAESGDYVLALKKN